MITERVLRKWRKEALHEVEMEKDLNDECTVLVNDLLTRILKLTQELLDQHLLRRKK